jgi:hypothetical protein
LPQSPAVEQYLSILSAYLRGADAVIVAYEIPGGGIDEDTMVS